MEIFSDFLDFFHAFLDLPGILAPWPSLRSSTQALPEKKKRTMNNSKPRLRIPSSDRACLYQVFVHGQTASKTTMLVAIAVYFLWNSFARERESCRHLLVGCIELGAWTSWTKPSPVSIVHFRTNGLDRPLCYRRFCWWRRRHPLAPLLLTVVGRRFCLLCAVFLCDAEIAKSQHLFSSNDRRTCAQYP